MSRYKSDRWETLFVVLFVVTFYVLVYGIAITVKPFPLALGIVIALSKIVQATVRPIGRWLGFPGYES